MEAEQKLLAHQQQEAERADGKAGGQQGQREQAEDQGPGDGQEASGGETAEEEARRLLQLAEDAQRVSAACMGFK